MFDIALPFLPITKPPYFTLRGQCKSKIPCPALGVGDVATNDWCQKVNLFGQIRLGKQCRPRSDTDQSASRGVFTLQFSLHLLRVIATSITGVQKFRKIKIRLRITNHC